jgi:hypothetical protein
MGSFGQGVSSTPITLTDKITHLDGAWMLDPTKGVRGSCATKDEADQTIRIIVSPQGVNVGRPQALLPLDGSPVNLKDRGERRHRQTLAPVSDPTLTPAPSVRRRSLDVIDDEHVDRLSARF